MNGLSPVETYGVAHNFHGQNRANQIPSSLCSNQPLLFLNRPKQLPLPPGLDPARNDCHTVDDGATSLRIPRTDVASGTSSRAMYFAGGCGIDSPAPDTDTQNGRRRKPARRDASGDDASSAPDLPLLVRRCQPTDVIDIFAPIAGTGGAGELKVAGKVPVSATSNFR